MSSTRSTFPPPLPMKVAESVPFELTGTTTLFARTSLARKLMVDEVGASVGSGPSAT